MKKIIMLVLCAAFMTSTVSAQEMDFPGFPTPKVTFDGSHELCTASIPAYCDSWVKTGTTKTILWTTENIPSSTKGILSLIGDSNKETIISSEVLNTGSYTWNIKEPAGHYRLKLTFQARDVASDSIPWTIEPVAEPIKNEPEFVPSPVAGITHVYNPIYRPVYKQPAVVLPTVVVSTSTSIGSSTMRSTTTQPSVKQLILQDLHVGMTDDDVLILQKYLNTNGYIINQKNGQSGSVGYETSYFGNLTKRALSRFQEDKGITPSQGYFGSKTRKVMGI